MAKLRIFRSLARLSPGAVLVSSIVVGLLLVALSFFVDVDSVSYLTFGTPREVGYLAALNWSLGFSLFVPFFLFFFLSALRSVVTTTEKLADSRMLVTKEMEIDRTAVKAARDHWNLISSRAGPWLLCLGVIALAVSYYEWWDFSGGPLLTGGSLTSVEENEADWSVAALMPRSSVNPWGNALLSLLTFSAQGLFILSLLAFFVFIYAFCELVAKLRDAREPILVLNLRSQDRRRGFQAFERITEEMLMAASLAFAAFYLSRIWNLYLHTRSPATGLWAFVFEDVARGFTSLNGPQIGRELLEAGSFDYSGSWVTIAALVLLPLSVAVPLFVLRRASLDARGTLEAAIENGSTAALQGLERKEALERLKEATVWPLGYPRANQLLVFGLLAVVSMFLFRIGLVYLGAALGLLVTRAFQALRPKKGGTTP